MRESETSTFSQIRAYWKCSFRIICCNVCVSHFVGKCHLRYLVTIVCEVTSHQCGWLFTHQAVQLIISRYVMKCIRNSFSSPTEWIACCLWNIALPKSQKDRRVYTYRWCCILVDTFNNTRSLIIWRVENEHLSIPTSVRKHFGHSLFWLSY